MKTNQILLIVICLIAAFSFYSLLQDNNTSISVSSGEKSVTVQSIQPAKPITLKTITQKTNGTNNPNTARINAKSIEGSNLDIKQDSSGNNSPNVLEIK